MRGRKGENTVYFAGRVHGRRLAPGVYLISLSPNRHHTPGAATEYVRVVSARRSLPLPDGAKKPTCTNVTSVAMAATSPSLIGGTTPKQATAQPSAQVAGVAVPAPSGDENDDGAAGLPDPGVFGAVDGLRGRAPLPRGRRPHARRRPPHRDAGARDALPARQLESLAPARVSLGGVQVQLPVQARPLRWVAPTLYLAALSAYMWREGIPVGRERLLIWIVLGLLALSTANLGGWVRGVVLEWLPFALLLAVYDLLRGHADGLLFSTWYRPQLEADAFLFGGNVPTVWLQDRIWHGSDSVRWYDLVAWAVYVSYFVATYLVAGLLWFFARARFRRYVACVVLLAGMAFATFALFPAAPPWLASDVGELDPTTRLIGPISGDIPFLSFSFEGLYERGSEYANPVAAVPSLHAAYTLLITLFLWRSAPRLGPAAPGGVSRWRWHSRSSTPPSTTSSTSSSAGRTR